jgi:hypothetical protein
MDPSEPHIPGVTYRDEIDGTTLVLPQSATRQYLTWIGLVALAAVVAGSAVTSPATMFFTVPMAVFVWPVLGFLLSRGSGKGSVTIHLDQHNLTIEAQSRTQRFPLRNIHIEAANNVLRELVITDISTNHQRSFLPLNMRMRHAQTLAALLQQAAETARSRQGSNEDVPSELATHLARAKGVES